LAAPFVDRPRESSKVIKARSPVETEKANLNSSVLYVPGLKRDNKRGLLALLQRWLRPTNIMLLDIIHQPFFIKDAKRFGGWFLSSSSG
jgi:hypothetical protein